MGLFGIIGVSLAAVLLLGLGVFFLVFQLEKKRRASSLKASFDSPRKVADVPSEDPIAFPIRIEEVMPEELPSEAELVEIKDKRLLSKIEQGLPSLLKNTQAAVDSLTKLKTSATPLYRAILPAGETLASSATLPGAFRGFSMGATGIATQANFVPVSNASAIAGNATNAVMAVASFVVGQYYLHEITGQLDTIGDRLSQVESFQNNSYRSRVMGLLAEVKSISDNQDEILENEDLRKSKIIQLDALESSCIELLGQANLSLASLEKKPTLDFKDYERKIAEAEEWYDYEKPLLSLLYQIADMKYALHFGKVSREECNGVLPPYEKQTQDAQSSLGRYHKEMMARLGIDLAKGQRKRKGVDKAVHALPGLFDKERNYCPLSEKTKTMLLKQSARPSPAEPADDSEFYGQDVMLFAKEGKLYYLPPKKTKKT